VYVILLNYIFMSSYHYNLNILANTSILGFNYLKLSPLNGFYDCYFSVKYISLKKIRSYKNVFLLKTIFFQSKTVCCLFRL